MALAWRHDEFRSIILAHRSKYIYIPAAIIVTARSIGNDAGRALRKGAKQPAYQGAILALDVPLLGLDAPSLAKRSPLQRGGRCLGAASGPQRGDEPLGARGYDRSLPGCGRTGQWHRRCLRRIMARLAAIFSLVQWV
jgi:hypothetical protein